MNVIQFAESAAHIAAYANEYLADEHPGEFTPGDVEAKLTLLYSGTRWECSLSSPEEPVLLVCSGVLDGAQLARYLADQLEALDAFDLDRAEDRTMHTARIDRLRDLDLERIEAELYKSKLECP